MIVSQLWRYPVKSLRGEKLESATFEPGGIPLDRSHAVIDSDARRLGKPLTGRLQKRLLGYASSVRAGRVMVRTPSGLECGVDERSWIDELEREIGATATIQSFVEPVHDDSDVLVLNAASVRVLSEEYGAAVDPMRFRANVILDGPDARPFEETGWTSGTFAVGDALMEVMYPCERCVVTTIDPSSLAIDPAFLRLIVEKHDARFGVYFRVVRGGIVKPGDAWRAVSGIGG
jgi:uncharacterized protein YcbX